jgi:hypothetical protein
MNVLVSTEFTGFMTNVRIPCRFLIVGNIFRLETCMNSLVKVLPYFKLNFQGKYFFTQNWCNITCAIILMRYTRNIFLLASDIFFINWTVHMSDNLPERVQILGHAHIICITVRENRMICCQIFCDLLDDL